MRIPAIVSSIGNWSYYVCSMTFDQINNYVSKIDKELHKSEKLSELLQRSITNNYKKISKYILEHDDRFFNAIVLAVYEGDPQFREVSFEYKGEQYGNMGLLEFTGMEVIFPVDGQHRVEGIKKALQEDPSISSETIPVIFIGHRNNPEGMERTRRLFSTLNRYAKPVKKSEIIALDEDDIIAITTRYLVENHQLFKDNRISLSTNLVESNTSAFTTIETLYDCNKFLFLNYHKGIGFKGGIENYLRVRPSDTEIDEFQNLCYSFWNIFSTRFSQVNEFLRLEQDGALPFRNSEGGNLLFRPVGLSSFIKAVSTVKKRTEKSYEQILEAMSEIDFSLVEKPWRHVLWNMQENKVIARNATLTHLLFIYIYQKRINETIVTNAEYNDLRKKYANKLTINIEEIDDILSDL
ncbi:DNA sulfur modification protein DndB [Bacillus kexueae]|uniref:DNA sulfur modification protein DndB n=1 Tax=Aeribacillus kexueae TaxID=2078952 RepID=UPI001FAF699D|nr:DNA sulfur modification protein DndB [Bacillus kexueae]